MSWRFNCLVRLTGLGRTVRVATITIVFLGIGGWLVKRGHRAYWETTIFQVQTVDFNILAHTLPTTLSLALVRKDWVTIQKVLDSNYSLFGLVVTDPEGKKILAMSKSKVVHDNFGWQRKLLEQPNSLQGHPYSYLVYPPPITPQISYASPYVKNPEPLQKPPGKIIGRIYYIRGIPPSIWEDLQMWMSKYFWAERDAFPLYSNTLLLTASLLVLTILLTEMIIHLKQQEVNQKQKDYEQLAQQCEQLAEQLSSEQQLNVYLKEELSCTRESLASLTALKAQYSQELETSRQEKRRLEEALEDISRDNRLLRERYEQISQKEHQLNRQIEQLKQEIEEKEQQIRSIREKQEQMQDTENTYLQRTRDLVNTHLRPSDGRDMTFELLEKLFELGFIPKFGSNPAQVFSPSDPFDRMTRMLSRNFSRLNNVLSQLIRCMQERRDSFSHRFSRIDDCINDFFDLLRRRGILYGLTWTQSEVTARINYNNHRFHECQKFLQGQWLEYYLHKKVCDFYRRLQRSVVCLFNLEFNTISGSSEFDLIAFIDRQIMVVFECKTGDYESFRDRISKYVNRSKQLQLLPKQFILLAARLEPQKRQELSQQHEITFAGLDDLDSALATAIGA
jgi:hypothetical protein